MKEIYNNQTKDFLSLLSTIVITIFLCNCATPYLYNKLGGAHRTTLILDKLHDEHFSPDMIVFGSSKAMMGIDGYQMTKELGVEVYNFSSTGQSPLESSLYYGFLPNSVKTVVQIIYAPLKTNGDVAGKGKKLPKNVGICFAMGGYELSEDIKRINSDVDLSTLEKPKFLQNIDARGSIFIPGLTDFLLPRDKEAAIDLKFCNSYLTPKHQMYERTIDQEMKKTHIGKSIEIDRDAVKILNNYAIFLKEKNITMIAVLMPSNPDVKEFSEEQATMIGEQCKSLMPDAIVFNYLSDKRVKMASKSEFSAADLIFWQSSASESGIR